MLALGINRRDVLKAFTSGSVAISALSDLPTEDLPVGCTSTPAPSADAAKAVCEIRSYVTQVLAGGGDPILRSDPVSHFPLNSCSVVKHFRRQKPLTITPPASMVEVTDMIKGGDDLRPTVVLTEIVRAGMADMYNKQLPWKLSSTIPLATPENMEHGIMPFRLQSMVLTCDLLELDAPWLSLGVWSLIKSLHQALVKVDASIREAHPTARRDYFVASPAWCAAELERFKFSLSAWLEASNRYTVSDNQ